MMGPKLLLFVSVLYALVALELVIDGKYGAGLAWSAYALANVGFAWDLGW